jgi:hypothetical protein
MPGAELFPTLAHGRLWLHPRRSDELAETKELAPREEPSSEKVEKFALPGAGDVHLGKRIETVSSTLWRFIRITEEHSVFQFPQNDREWPSDVTLRDTVSILVVGHQKSRFLSFRRRRGAGNSIRAEGAIIRRSLSPKHSCESLYCFLEGGREPRCSKQGFWRGNLHEKGPSSWFYPGMNRYLCQSPPAWADGRGGVTPR